MACTQCALDLERAAQRIRDLAASDSSLLVMIPARLTWPDIADLLVHSAGRVREQAARFAREVVPE